jgi:hypothetical protein
VTTTIENKMFRVHVLGFRIKSHFSLSRLAETLLTIIPLGKIKVDLDGSDFKLQKNFLCTALKNTIPVGMSCKYF